MGARPPRQGAPVKLTAPAAQTFSSRRWPLARSSGWHPVSRSREGVEDGLGCAVRSGEGRTVFTGEKAGAGGRRHGWRRYDPDVGPGFFGFRSPALDQSGLG